MDENETMLTVAHNLRNVKIEDEMKNCYIDYAMSVIIGRALPDVRDGLSRMDFTSSTIRIRLVSLLIRTNIYLVSKNKRHSC